MGKTKDLFLQMREEDNEFINEHIIFATLKPINKPDEAVTTASQYIIVRA